jgi:hypothetical protein
MPNWTYSYTNLTGSNNITGVARWVNEVTGDSFWLLAFMGIWVVLFISMYRPGKEKEAFVSSSFVSAMVSYLFAAMQLINASYVMIPTAMTLLGVLLLVRKGD